MQTIQLLNNGLYEALQNKFGDVRVVHEGQHRTYASFAHGGNIENWGETFRINCPFCGDQRQRLHVSYLFNIRAVTSALRRQPMLKCFNEDCQRNATNVAILAARLAEQGYLPVRRDSLRRANDHASVPASRPIRLPESFQLLCQLRDDHEAIRYVRHRGFDSQELSLSWGVGCSDEPEGGGSFSGHGLIFPILGPSGSGKLSLVGWQARRIREQGFGPAGKYFTARGTRVSQVLYNLHCAADTEGPLVLVEGVLDCFRVGPSAVGLFGKLLSQSKLQQLLSNALGREIVLLLDADARREAVDIKQMLIRTGRVDPAQIGIAKLPGGASDPAEATTEAIWGAIWEALGKPADTPIPWGKIIAVPPQMTRCSSLVREKLGSRIHVDISPAVGPRPRRRDAIMSVSGSSGISLATNHDHASLLQSLGELRHTYCNARESFASIPGLRMSQLPEKFDCIATMDRLLEMHGTGITQPPNRQRSQDSKAPDGSGVIPDGLSFLDNQKALGVLPLVKEKRLQLKRARIFRCYQQVELPLIPILAKMQHNDLLINIDRLRLLVDKRRDQGAAQFVASATKRIEKVRCHLNGLGTQTGRIQASGPNLPGWRRSLRSAIVAHKGNNLIVADQRELHFRIAAAFAADERLLADLAEGLDLHRWTAAQLFSKPEKRITSRERQLGKRLNSALLNGGSISKVGREANIDVASLSNWETVVERRLGALIQWRDEISRQGKQTGFATSSSGRSRRLCEPSSDFGSDAAIGRSAIATVLQGTEADLLKMHLVRLHQGLPKGCKLQLPLHDGVLIEAPKRLVSEAVEVVQSVMQQDSLGLNIPLMTKTGTGSSWAEGSENVVN